MVVKKTPNSYCYDMVSASVNVGVSSALEKDGIDVINNWSPNNIRRLVVSADGFLVQYFVTAKNSRLVNPVIFRDRLKLQDCLFNPKYKPMVQTLTGSRICSSVEEIVYLTKSNTWGMNLPASELDIKSLLSAQKASVSSDLLKDIGDRFVRLHGLVILNMSLKEFYTSFKDKLNKPDFQISDMPNLNGNVTLLHEDWWKHTYLRPNYYSLDEKDGKLDSYFSKVKASFELREKQEKLSKLGSKSVKSESTNLDAFHFIRNSVLAIYNLTRANTIPILDGDVSAVLRSIIALKIHKSNVSFNVSDEYNNLSTKDKKFIDLFSGKLNIDKSNDVAFNDSITLYSQALYVSVLEFTFNIIENTCREYKIYGAYNIKACNFSADVPDILNERLVSLENTLGFSIPKANQKQTMVNCIIAICRLIVPTDVTSSKGYLKDYWLERLEGDL